MVATSGMIAPAATATKPAIKAYSTRSWPRVSFQILSFQTQLVIVSSFSFCPRDDFPRHYEYVITGSRYDYISKSASNSNDFSCITGYWYHLLGVGFD